MTRLIALVCALYLPMTVMAEEYLYDCDLPGARDRSKGYVWEKTVFVVKADGTVLVSDPIILAKIGQPMPARVQRNTDKVLSVRWQLRLTDISEQHFTFNYSARLNKKSGTVSVTARPADAPQSFVGRGTCTRRTG